MTACVVDFRSSNLTSLSTVQILERDPVFMFIKGSPTAANPRLTKGNHRKTISSNISLVEAEHGRWLPSSSIHALFKKCVLPLISVCFLRVPMCSYIFVYVYPCVLHSFLGVPIIVNVFIRICMSSESCSIPKSSKYVGTILQTSNKQFKLSTLSISNGNGE